MVRSAAPRRAASAANATGPSACPDCDTATTRSMAPTQPGNGRLCRVCTGTGDAGSASSSSTSAITADPPSAATSTDRGRSPPVSRSNLASAARSTACRTWAPAVASARSVWRESSAARACWSSRALSSMYGMVSRASAGYSRVDRASSASSTGTPSSIRYARPHDSFVHCSSGCSGPTPSANSDRHTGQRRMSRSHGSILGVVSVMSPDLPSSPGCARVPRPARAPSSHGRRPRRSAGAAARCWTPGR
jgi:hypothetical protein